MVNPSTAPNSASNTPGHQLLKHMENEVIALKRQVR